MGILPALWMGLACSGGGLDKDSPTGPDGGLDATTPPRDAGRVVLHRLNRTEYDNTVRDLLGTTSTPARDFPTDDMVGGWDNIASNLSMSPLHVELYELAAQALAEEVLAGPLEDIVAIRGEAEGADVTATVGGPAGSAWNLWSNGSLSMTFEAPVDGTYTLSTRVWGQQGGPDLAGMALSAVGVEVLTTDVAASSEGTAEVISADVALTAGVHTVQVSFLNDYYDPNLGEDRNLFVDWLESAGPIAGANPLRDRWVTCDAADTGDDVCAKTAIEALASRAWRRPITAEEVAGLSALVDSVLADGGTFDDALRWGFVSVLVSPNFLYRVEIDPDPASAEPHPLTGYELASRLSYFLWSSMPDDALFDAAARDELSTPEQIATQVRRMLDDPKASALVDNFGGQWLFIRGLDDAFKDPYLFPGFDDALRSAMKEETTRFFSSFVFGDRDMHELITATEGEIDAILADHYGVPFSGTGWQGVDLASVHRGGLLGQAGVLAVNAYATRTSPVIRGKFVLGQLMCSEPPPPPPDIPALEAQADAVTIREQLEQHRADPVCASCHEAMDNIGFGLENFDAIGAWREVDGGQPIDASGELFDTLFDGPQELTALISTDPRFESCIAEQAYTYALGRMPELTDGPFLSDIEASFAAGGFTFEALVTAIATSEPFTTRRGEL
jgi:hypothetical protein